MAHLRAPQKPVATPRAMQSATDIVDTSFLESLLGYNARRAALAVIDVFLKRMAQFQLKPVDFSVLSVVAHNPGITSRQLCHTLGILPPNLVGMVNALEKRELVVREPHPRDGRAMGLHLTDSGVKLVGDAERVAAALEADVAGRLSPTELKTLIKLLKKVYQPA
ncbi:MAG: MarR family transcriptional regulator [Comamonadaceae bacterium]|nr:MAG: MarR family transcriptional regulator [Comamonadaceae bacterium]